jgi:membrane fusion protein (multidrug efflux system)
VLTKRTLATLAALLTVTACSGRDDGAVPSAQAKTLTTGGDTAALRSTGGSETSPRAAAGAPGQGRVAPVITLASSDVATVRRGSIEEGIAVTGDLRPIESVEVRARLEGDLDGVYVREGERVRAGQVLARFEASEQESAQTSADADRVAAESDLATAQWNLDQTTELFKAGAVAERDLKTAQQAVISSRARLAAAQARVRATSSTVTDTRVTAPTSGVIAQRLAENGMHMSRGAPLFTLVRSDVLELAAAVPARQANAVRVGQTVHFSADARAFDGKVARVSPTIDPQSRSVTVYVQVPNGSGALKGGTFASGRVVSRTVRSTLVIPASAVHQSQDAGKPFVYRIAGKVIDVATVDVGVVDERAGTAEILQGLRDGDRLVVGNVGVLGRGMQVIIIGEEGGERRAGSGGSAR